MHIKNITVFAVVRKMCVYDFSFGTYNLLWQLPQQLQLQSVLCIHTMRHCLLRIVFAFGVSFCVHRANEHKIYIKAITRNERTLIYGTRKLKNRQRAREKEKMQLKAIISLNENEPNDDCRFCIVVFCVW